MSETRDGPYSVARGSIQRDGYLLTNVEWHPNNWFGDFAQYETGVRRIVRNHVEDGSFVLVQHNWSDFSAANDILLCGLKKGWPITRIETLMQWLEERARRR